MKTEEINARIQALRDVMQQEGVDAVIIPQTDPHQGEYLADHWQVRRWLSGFTGSAGDLVVTRTKAFVWADSRYWLQAAAQLKDTCIGVMEDGKPEVPSIAAYLSSNLPAGATVGIDGMVFSVNAAETLEKHSPETVSACASISTRPTSSGLTGPRSLRTRSSSTKKSTPAKAPSQNQPRHGKCQR